MTAGNIGTFLYIAPELMETPRAIRDQKVDIYSLGKIFLVYKISSYSVIYLECNVIGIILFEMCYGGLNSGMERIIVLLKIRRKEIEYPQEFLDEKYLKQRTIIK